MLEPDSARSDVTFTAKDVRQLTGLTYRQLNDWEFRGAMPHDRDNEEGWRRFTAKELFALMVCARLRKNLKIPLDQLRQLQTQLLHKECLPLKCERVDKTKSKFWLSTDFTTCRLGEANGHVPVPSPNSLVFVAINVTPLEAEFAAFVEAKTKRKSK